MPPNVSEDLKLFPIWSESCNHSSSNMFNAEYDDCWKAEHDARSYTLKVTLKKLKSYCDPDE